MAFLMILAMLSASRQSSVAHLSADELAALKARGWTEHVGGERGLWVSGSRQCLFLIRRQRVMRCFRCSTAKAGFNCREHSLGTPTGWHQIAEKIGQGLRCGAVLRGRRWTGDVWPRDGSLQEDLILSRILRLAGLEDGINRGGSVDSFARFIYIHGTNHEDQISTPASHGCIRLSNKDAIALFRLVAVGTKVFISQ